MSTGTMGKGKMANRSTKAKYINVRNDSLSNVLLSYSKGGIKLKLVEKLKESVMFVDAIKQALDTIELFEYAVRDSYSLQKEVEIMTLYLEQISMIDTMLKLRKEQLKLHMKQRKQWIKNNKREKKRKNE